MASDFAGGNRSISLRGPGGAAPVSVFAGGLAGAFKAASAADAAASAAEAVGDNGWTLTSFLSSDGGFGTRSSTFFGCILAPTASVLPVFLLMLS